MEITKDALLTFMREELDLPAAKIGDETPLFSGGILDSSMLVILITLIERSTGKRIPTLEFTLENFDSVERILAFVKKYSA